RCVFRAAATLAHASELGWQRHRPAASMCSSRSKRAARWSDNVAGGSTDDQCSRSTLTRRQPNDASFLQAADIQLLSGGRQEARTPDLRVANAALSQLS